MVSSLSRFYDNLEGYRIQWSNFKTKICDNMAGMTEEWEFRLTLIRQ